MSATSTITPKQELVAEITGEDATVAISKIITPCGTRIEISAPDTGNGIRLDPLELESLTWQSPESLREILGTDVSTEVKALIQESSTGAVTGGGETIQVGNEFADVEVRKKEVNGTEVLNIVSPKLNYSTNIPAVVLHALTAHDATLFSQFLETPFGPKGEAGHEH